MSWSSVCPGKSFASGFVDVMSFVYEHTQCRSSADQLQAMPQATKSSEIEWTADVVPTALD